MSHLSNKPSTPKFPVKSCKLCTYWWICDIVGRCLWQLSTQRNANFVIATPSWAWKPGSPFRLSWKSGQSIGWKPEFKFNSYSRNAHTWGIHLLLSSHFSSSKACLQMSPRSIIANEKPSAFWSQIPVSEKKFKHVSKNKVKVQCQKTHGSK